MAARYEEGRYEKYISSHIFLFAKDHRPMASGWQGAPPYFRRYGRGLLSEPAISLKKSRGGYRSKTHRKGTARYDDDRGTTFVSDIGF